MGKPFYYQGFMGGLCCRDEVFVSELVFCVGAYV